MTENGEDNEREINGESHFMKVDYVLPGSSCVDL